jgi:glycerophosphoryl diester phosphodiesterase
MLVIAHRGNNKEAFENSFSAFEKSVECGAHRIELDVVLSKDGHAVINHDDHLMHATGKAIFCSKLTKVELANLKLLNGEPIPFLNEVVERFLGRIELNIEIKGNNAEAGRAVGDIIGRHSQRDKVIVSSFFPESLVYMRNHHPDIQRACLTGDDELPWPYFSHLAILNFMTMTASTIVHPRMGQISASFMDQCKSRGWKVFTWSPMVGEDHGREAWWTLLKTLDVDGHCTNFPRELGNWLRHQTALDERAKRLLTFGNFRGKQDAHSHHP